MLWCRWLCDRKSIQPVKLAVSNLLPNVISWRIRRTWSKNLNKKNYSNSNNGSSEQNLQFTFFFLVPYVLQHALQRMVQTEHKIYAEMTQTLTWHLPDSCYPSSAKPLCTHSRFHTFLNTMPQQIKQQLQNPVWPTCFKVGDDIKDNQFLIFVPYFWHVQKLINWVNITVTYSYIQVQIL